MEATKKISRRPALLEVAEKLKQAQQEIDEFTVQLALGSAEAKEKFEELKRNLKQHLADLKVAFRLVSREDRLRAKIDELEQFIKDAEAKDPVSFDEQKQRIMAAITYVEAEMLTRFKLLPAARDFVHEVEKFKLKLEILSLKVGLKKFVIKDNVSRRFREARKKVDTLISKAARQVGGGGFSVTDEIRQAYKHVRKAVVAR
jgi:hypothetical protein